MGTRNTRTPAGGLQVGFPFDYAAHLDGDRRIGRLPPTAHGTPVAVVGAGGSGLTAAYELLRAGCRPVVHEAETDPAGPGGGRRLGGWMFSLRLAEADSAVVEPDSTPLTVLDIDGIRYPARRITGVSPLNEEFRQARTRWPDAPDGISTLAEGFWTHRATGPTGWATSLEQCNRGTLRPAVTALEVECDPARGVVVHSDDGARERFAAVVFTLRLHLLETNVELRYRGATASPFGPRLWRAVRRLSYWENRRNFRGMCRFCRPGERPYQRDLFSHFMKDFTGEPAVPGEPPHALFLAGDDTSWSPGRPDHALATGLNAAWGVLHHLGGACDPDNPGPGDVCRFETGDRTRSTTVPRERHE